MNATIFDIFVYQFNPLSNISLDFDLTSEQAYDKKNILFNEILESELRFHYRNMDLNYSVIFQNDRYTFIKIANQKYINIEKNFKKKKVLSEPSAIIIIDNDPVVQKIYIEQCYKAFSSTDNLKQIVEKALKKKLERKGLSIAINAVYNEKDFWKLIKGKEKEIYAISFEFSYFNLAAAHENVSEGLKLLNNSMNGAKNKTEISAEKGHHLENVNEDNKFLNDMVQGSADGQGKTKYKELGSIYWKSTDMNNKIVEVKFEIKENMDEAMAEMIISEINNKLL